MIEVEVTNKNKENEDIKYRIIIGDVALLEIQTMC